MKFIKIDDDLVNIKYISFVCFDDVDNVISIYNESSDVPMTYEYDDNFDCYLSNKRYIIEELIKNSEV